MIDLSADEFPAADTDDGEQLRAGYEEFFDVVDFDDVEAFKDAIRVGEIDLIVSRNREALEVAVEEDVTYFSTHASATAALEGVRAADEPIDVQDVNDRPKTATRWGGD